MDSAAKAVAFKELKEAFPAAHKRDINAALLLFDYDTNEAAVWLMSQWASPSSSKPGSTGGSSAGPVSSQQPPLPGPASSPTASLGTHLTFPSSVAFPSPSPSGPSPRAATPEAAPPTPSLMDAPEAVPPNSSVMNAAEAAAPTQSLMNSPEAVPSSASLMDAPVLPPPVAPSGSSANVALPSFLFGAALGEDPFLSLPMSPPLFPQVKPPQQQPLQEQPLQAQPLKEQPRQEQPWKEQPRKEQPPVDESPQGQLLQEQAVQEQLPQEQPPQGQSALATDISLDAPTTSPSPPLPSVPALSSEKRAAEAELPSPEKSPLQAPAAADATAGPGTGREVPLWMQRAFEEARVLAEAGLEAEEIPEADSNTSDVAEASTPSPVAAHPTASRSDAAVSAVEEMAPSPDASLPLAPEVLREGSLNDITPAPESEEELDSLQKTDVAGEVTGPVDEEGVEKGDEKVDEKVEGPAGVSGGGSLAGGEEGGKEAEDSADGFVEVLVPTASEGPEEEGKGGGDGVDKEETGKEGAEKGKEEGDAEKGEEEEDGEKREEGEEAVVVEVEEGGGSGEVEEDPLAWSVCSVSVLSSGLDVASFNPDAFNSILDKTSARKGELMEGIRDVASLQARLRDMEVKAQETEEHLMWERAREEEQQRLSADVQQAARGVLEARSDDLLGEKGVLKDEAQGLLKRLRALEKDRGDAMHKEIAELKEVLSARIAVMEERVRVAEKEVQALEASKEQRKKLQQKEEEAIARRIKDLDDDKAACNKLKEFLNEKCDAIDALEGGFQKCAEDLSALRQSILAASTLEPLTGADSDYAFAQHSAASSGILAPSLGGSSFASFTHRTAAGHGGPGEMVGGIFGSASQKEVLQGLLSSSSEGSQSGTVSAAASSMAEGSEHHGSTFAAESQRPLTAEYPQGVFSWMSSHSGNPLDAVAGGGSFPFPLPRAEDSSPVVRVHEDDAAESAPATEDGDDKEDDSAPAAAEEPPVNVQSTKATGGARADACGGSSTASPVNEDEWEDVSYPQGE